jgi:hypothetical protein
MLRENTTNYETEIELSLPGGANISFHSVDQIDSSVLVDVGGAYSYTMSVRCMITGESEGLRLT